MDTPLKREDEERLTKVFRRIFKNDELALRNDLTAKDVPGWDSFNHINLVIEIEEEFNQRFSTEEISGLKNVGDMKTLLASKIY